MLASRVLRQMLAAAFGLIPGRSPRLSANYSKDLCRAVDFLRSSPHILIQNFADVPGCPTHSR